MKFRVYRIMNSKEGTTKEFTFESDSIEKAQRSAITRAKKENLLPDKKHSQTYGHISWINKSDSLYYRNFVFGNKYYRTKDITLFLEVL